MASVIVVAAGVPYYLRSWWRPGLPPLQENGELVIADEGVDGRRRNLIIILERCADGSYQGIIPDEDITTIQQQARRWLNIIEGNQ